MDAAKLAGFTDLKVSGFFSFTNLLLLSVFRLLYEFCAKVSKRVTNVAEKIHRISSYNECCNGASSGRRMLGEWVSRTPGQQIKQMMSFLFFQQEYAKCLIELFFNFP
jgi:hypothetical protein